MNGEFPTLALDVDGVLIAGFPRARWDVDLEAELGINPRLMQQQFFAPHWQNVLRGALPVETALAGFLAECDTSVTVEEFLAYWHGRDAQVVEAVIVAAINWRERTGGQIVLATNQDLTRARYLREDLGFGQWCDKMVVSSDVGAIKPDAAFFVAADEIIGTEMREAVTFLDDLPANVHSATRHGWRSHHIASVDDAAALIDTF